MHMQFESIVKNFRTVFNVAFLILPKCLGHTTEHRRFSPVGVELGDATGASYSPLRARQAKPVIVNLVQV